MLSPRCLFYLANRLSIPTLFLFLQFHLIDLLAGTMRPVGLILPYSLQLHTLLLQLSLMSLFLRVLKDLIDMLITNSMVLLVYFPQIILQSILHPKFILDSFNETSCFLHLR